MSRGESPTAKFLIGGGVTVALELFGGHTLEFLKIAKQTSAEPYGVIARRVTATKGAAGLLDGFLPWGLIQALAKGSVFAYGQALSLNLLRRVPPSAGLSRDHAVVLSGGVGGFVQGLAMSPILLLKTRVMTDPSFRGSGGVLATAAASARVGAGVIAREGPAALFKGVGLFSCKRALDWTTRYLFVVFVEGAMRGGSGRRLGAWEEAGASLLGGTLSALSTIPMDVMVAAKQGAGAAGKKVGFFSTLAEKVREDGVAKTLSFSTRGLAARVVHVAVTTLAMKNVTSLVYDVLCVGHPPLSPPRPPPPPPHPPHALARTTTHASALACARTRIFHTATLLLPIPQVPSCGRGQVAVKARGWLHLNIICAFTSPRPGYRSGP